MAYKTMAIKNAETTMSMVQFSKKAALRGTDNSAPDVSLLPAVNRIALQIRPACRRLPRYRSQ